MTIHRLGCLKLSPYTPCQYVGGCPQHYSQVSSGDYLVEPPRSEMEAYAGSGLGGLKDNG
jgi:hypothetical protein